MWDTLDEDRIGELSVGEMKASDQSVPSPSPQPNLIVKAAMKHKMSTLGLKKGQLLGRVVKLLAIYAFEDETVLTFKDFISLLHVR